MRNLTSNSIELRPRRGETITIEPCGVLSGIDAAPYLVAVGDGIDIGTGVMDTARIGRMTSGEDLNQRLEEEIRKDRDAGGTGLVLVEQAALPHVKPELAEFVAAPSGGSERRPDGGLICDMLIRPPAADPDGRSEEAGYTLLHDEVGVATDNPRTRELGRAATWTELCWMAKGARPFERGGRLWGRGDSTGSVFHLADMNLSSEDAPRYNGNPDNL